MRVTVKTLWGANFTIECNAHDTLDEFADTIEKNHGIPWEQQRLLYHGKRLEMYNTLADYAISTGDTIHLVLRLRGMISNYAEATTPTAKALAKGGAYLKRVYDTILPTLSENSVKDQATSHRAYRVLNGVGNYIQAVWGERLRVLADRLYHHYRHDADLKLVFEGASRNLLDRVVGFRGFSANLLALYISATGGPAARPPKFVLRRSEAPSAGPIDFHCDGSYATYTLQLVLTEAKTYGGELVFYDAVTGLNVLETTFGRITIHPRESYHAVTSLRRGTRYSLFVVDEDNGLGSDEHVKKVSEESLKSLGGWAVY